MSSNGGFLLGLALLVFPLDIYHAIVEEANADFKGKVKIIFYVLMVFVFVDSIFTIIASLKAETSKRWNMFLGIIITISSIISLFSGNYVGVIFAGVFAYLCFANVSDYERIGVVVKKNKFERTVQDRLIENKNLFDSGLISYEEYIETKNKILESK